MYQKLKEPYSLFRSDIGTGVAQSQGMFENQGLITEMKNYLH